MSARAYSGHAAEPLEQLRVLFTPKTLAAYLQVSERTVREWVRRGDLPSYKLAGSRRIDPTDVEEFLATHREGHTMR